MRIVGLLVEVKHLFHLADEGSAFRGWNHPLGRPEEGLGFVFFSSRATMVVEMCSTTSNSTRRSARTCGHQAGASSGGDWQTRAVKWASTRPSIFLSERTLRTVGANKARPVSQNCFRTYSTVLVLVPNTAAIAVAVRRPVFSSLLSRI